jgi:hypothetical protein
MIFVMDMCCVFDAVGTELLNIILMRFIYKRVNLKNANNKKSVTI